MQNILRHAPSFFRCVTTHYDLKDLPNTTSTYTFELFSFSIFFLHYVDVFLTEIGFFKVLHNIGSI